VEEITAQKIFLVVHSLAEYAARVKGEGETK